MLTTFSRKLLKSRGINTLKKSCSTAITGSKISSGVRKDDGGYCFELGASQGRIIPICPGDDLALLGINNIIAQSQAQIVFTDLPGVRPSYTEGFLARLKRETEFRYLSYRYIGFKEIFSSEALVEQNVRLHVTNGVKVHDVGPARGDIRRWLHDDYCFAWTLDAIDNMALTEVITTVQRLPHRSLPFDHAIRLLFPPPRTSRHARSYDFLRYHPHFIESLRRDIREHVLPEIKYVLEETGSSRPESSPSFVVFARKLFATVLAQEIDKLRFTI